MKVYLSILMVLLLNSILFGDGMSFKGNRLNGYTTSTFSLTDSQQVELTNIDSLYFKKIELTASQKEFLQKSSKYALDSLTIYSLELAQNTCTCETFDFGILFSTNKVEVPHRHLGRKEFMAAYESGNSDYTFFEEPLVVNKYVEGAISRYEMIGLFGFLILLGLFILVRRKRTK